MEVFSVTYHEAIKLHIMKLFGRSENGKEKVCFVLDVYDEGSWLV